MRLSCLRVSTLVIWCLKYASNALVLFPLLALVPLRESPIATIIIIPIYLLPRESTYINSMYLELMILRRGLVCCDSWGRKESDMTE